MSKPRMEWVLVLELGAGGERQVDPEAKHAARGPETWVESWNHCSAAV